MKKQMTYWSAVLVFMALPLLQGCDDGLTGPNGRKTTVLVDQLELSPSTLEIEVGTHYPINAKLNHQDIAPRAVAWSSSNPDIAQVSDDGLVRGLATGNVIITAEHQGRTGTTWVRVSAVEVDGGGDGEVSGKNDRKDERER